jgi:hypothetical protein
MSDDLRKALEQIAGFSCPHWSGQSGPLHALPWHDAVLHLQAIAQAALTSSQDGWRAIESAPRDDNVLGYAPDAHAGKQITNVIMKYGKPLRSIKRRSPIGCLSHPLQ